MADVPVANPHLCLHCEHVVFTLDGYTFFTYGEIERAREAGCEFFQSIHNKHPIADTTGSSRCPTLVAFCDEGGLIDFRWVDDATELLHSDDASSMFAPEGHPASVHFHIRPLNSTPGSSESFGQIRRWIRRCDKRHKRCKELREALSQQCPTRLIDVGNADSEDVCLHLTVPKSALQYAALSYCWGGKQESMTVRARLEKRREGFRLAELPRTIQDAIVTTRRLGLRYLWVDAICIIQDDPGDKERELAIMDQIYSGASITIVAARAEKADDGFLQDRDVKQCYGTVCRVKYRRSSEGHGEIGSGFLSAERLHISYDDPIDSRGWTFQERLRSFRTLRFGRKQTVWECPGYRCVDGGENYSEGELQKCLFTGTVADSTYPHNLNDPSQRHELNWVLEAWQHLVFEYSKRTLSQREDRLPAFSAMAKAFGTFLQLEPEQYLAGLWAFDVCRQLRWWRPSHVLGDRRCNERRGPTWSWASLDGPVTFDHPRLPMGVDTLQVVEDECRIRWKSPDLKYGEVEYARLAVAGFLRLAILMKGVFFGLHHGDVFRLPLVARWDCNEERTPEVWCLEINTDTSEKKSFGILLTKSASNTIGIYKRLGYFEFDHNDLDQEPIKAGLPIPRRYPLNSNWFSNGGYEKIYIE